MRFGAIKTKPGSKLAFIMVPLKDRPRPKKASVVRPQGLLTYRPEPVVIPPPEPVVIPPPKPKKVKLNITRPSKPVVIPKPEPVVIPKRVITPTEKLFGDDYTRIRMAITTTLHPDKSVKLKKLVEDFILKYSFAKYADLSNDVEKSIMKIQTIASEDLNINVRKLLEDSTGEEDPILLIE